MPRYLFRGWKLCAALLGFTAVCLNALAQAPPPTPTTAGSQPQAAITIDPSVMTADTGGALQIQRYRDDDRLTERDPLVWPADGSGRA